MKGYTFPLGYYTGSVAFGYNMLYFRYLLTMSLEEKGARMNLFKILSDVSQAIFAPFFLLLIILSTRKGVTVSGSLASIL